MPNSAVSKILAFLAMSALAFFLLFELVPPVTRVGAIGVKLVPVSELVSASVEGFNPQDTPLARRSDLIRGNITALGIAEQLQARGIILAIGIALAFYALLPGRFRFLLPFSNAVDTAAQSSSLYRTYTRLICHPVFFGVTILLIAGLVVQNEFLDTPGSLPVLTKVHCSVAHPCNVWSRPFLADPF